jgi:hypothetical protein
VKGGVIYGNETSLEQLRRESLSPNDVIDRLAKRSRERDCEWITAQQHERDQRSVCRLV